MHVIGSLLFTIGSVVALTSAAKVPLALAWSFQLFIYMVAITVMVLGLWLWRRPLSVLEQSLETSFSKDRQNILELLPPLLTTMQSLVKLGADNKREEIIIGVEEVLNQYVFPLVAAREEVCRWLGRYSGVEMLIAIAQGERLLNRVKSAACDGCWGEVYATLPKALAAFEMAEQFCRGILAPAK